jgi:hypothetical protein
LKTYFIFSGLKKEAKKLWNASLNLANVTREITKIMAEVML